MPRVLAQGCTNHAHSSALGKTAQVPDSDLNLPRDKESIRCSQASLGALLVGIVQGSLPSLVSLPPCPLPEPQGALTALTNKEQMEWHCMVFKVRSRTVTQLSAGF